MEAHRGTEEAMGAPRGVALLSGPFDEGEGRRRGWDTA
jgi:hypothetical protein